MNPGWQLAIDIGIIVVLLLGIWQFRSTRFARSGNFIAAIAFLSALAVVWWRHPVLSPSLVLAALLVGGLAGGLVAMRVNMLQIPAMVAFQHGAGGIAAFLISFIELLRERADPTLVHAQFEVVTLANRLREMGKEVKFAIHPIAGRMPGHMHVLLGEAEADPDMIYDMAEINSEFRTTDLAIVVGACDVVNPAARHAEGTPISGMPILAAHEAKQILVCNLDGRPGYSGVENPLYTSPHAILLFGDARASLAELLEALR
jgi:NAD/NADP transhydrogenase beta subunit